MDYKQKQYIEQNIDLIENSRWEELFAKLPCIGVGQLLYEAGINFLEDVSEIHQSMFACSGLTDLVIPNNITRIGKGAFYECKSLTSVTIGNGVTSIEAEAFGCCTALTSIELPVGLKSIEKHAFMVCTSLKSIDLPEGLETIESYSFGCCNSLVNMEIPKSVTRIRHDTFYRCTSLTKIVVNNPNATFDRSVFNYVSSDFELHGYKGSTAEAYASENGLKFVSID